MADSHRGERGTHAWAWSTGNIASSTADVARFFRALLRGRLLPPHLLRAMQTTVRTGSLFDYGLGLVSLPLPCGGTVWGHEGGLPGYENWALSTRDGTQQVITMINAGTGDDKVELVLVSAVQAFCAVRGI
ncbi:MAG TPA: hypothetical protein VGP91_02085 [Actinoplanes sp.]|nr:hypothetical protein [Actinoplanes sp.]